MYNVLKSHTKKSTTNEDILWSKMLHNTPSSLNTAKGIVRCTVLSRVTNNDIKEGMAEQGVTDVHRITVRPDGIKKPADTFLLTFNSPNLPTDVKIGCMQVKVDVYLPNPLRCYNCQVFGHHKNECSIRVAKTYEKVLWLNMTSTT